MLTAVIAVSDRCSHLHSGRKWHVAYISIAIQIVLSRCLGGRIHGAAWRGGDALTRTPLR